MASGSKVSKVNNLLAKKVALSCRILAKLGLFKETTGHVSCRSSDGKSMLIRGRGRDETGLLFTRPRDIIPAGLDGKGLRDRLGIKPPNESCIHGEIYQARSDVAAVVHAHPPSVVLCSMAGIELRPIYGGYDPQGMKLALDGIPVYPSSVTLHAKEQVHAMMEFMGRSDVCVLRGHGLVVTGKSVEEATVRAIKVDTLARMNLQAASLGNVPAIDEEDVQVFSARGDLRGKSTDSVWRFYVEWVGRDS
jgi:ribulose-5-phosphate 4-epimerase/fuculose-1-phosphate aldolase